MKYVSYFFWLTILAGLNFGVFSNLDFFGKAPNLFLLFVVLAGSLKEGLFERLFIALLSGLFADYFNGGFFGGYMLAFLFLCLVLQGIRASFSLVEMDWKYFFGVFVLAYIFTSLFVWVYNLVAFRLHWTEFYTSFLGLIQKWPAELVYNLVLLLPVKKFFEFIQKINRRYFEIGSQ